MARETFASEADHLLYLGKRLDTIVVSVLEHGAIGDGVADDTAAINRAVAAADALQADEAATVTKPSIGAVVYFPPGTYLTSGISLSGKSCTIRGSGAASVIKGKAGISGYVLDLTGYGYSGNSMQPMEFADFWVRGSGEAGAAKGGIRVAGAGLTFRNIGVKETGGPSFYFDNVQLSNFENLIAGRPVAANTNNVPYVHVVGASIGNRWIGLGLRSETDTADGTSALLIEPDATFSPSDNLFLAGWGEYCHPPANGSIVVCKRGSLNVFDDWQWFDNGTIGTSVANTSFYRFADAATGTDFGGNIVRGKIPGGSAGADSSLRYGVILEQSRNRIEGIRGLGGNNVLISAGVNYSYISLGGQESGDTNSLSAVVDNAATGTNVVINSFYKGVIIDSLYVKDIVRFGTPASDGSSDGPLMLRSSGALITRGSSLTFQNLAGSVNGLVLSPGSDPAAQFSSSATTPGDFEVTVATRGLVLRAPNGTRYRLTVDNTGVLSTTAI